MSSHTMKRIQVSSGSPAIKTMQQRMEISGKKGTNGTRNNLGRCGWLRRSTITPRETSTNANSVVGKLRERVDVPNPGWDAHYKACNPRTDVRRLKPLVHRAEQVRQQAVARH